MIHKDLENLAVDWRNYPELRVMKRSSVGDNNSYKVIKSREEKKDLK